VAFPHQPFFTHPWLWHDVLCPALDGPNLPPHLQTKPLCGCCDPGGHHCGCCYRCWHVFVVDIVVVIVAVIVVVGWWRMGDVTPQMVMIQMTMMIVILLIQMMTMFHSQQQRKKQMQEKSNGYRYQQPL
jgi:hypothetical protein